MKHRIFVQGTDVAFDCDEELSVFEAMVKNRKGPLSYGCYGGGCGVCKARVIDGNYYAYKPMSAAFINETNKKEGFVLLCCIKPRGDLSIAVG